MDPLTVWVHLFSASFQTFVSLLFFLSHAQSLYFNFTHFETNTPNITYANDTDPGNGAIQLTKTMLGDSKRSAGRASYSQPVRLWDRKTNKVTNFTTHFSFNITLVGSDKEYGDGMTFFLAPFDDSTAYAPSDSTGGCLGLMSGTNLSCSVKSKYPFVAVEFDTFSNRWDPNKEHLGINVESVKSEVNVSLRGGLKKGTTGNAWITYDSSTKNLSVYLTYAARPVFNGKSKLSYGIDLRTILPETVRIGFSAATGTKVELHNILSWDFNSTLVDTEPPKPPGISIAALIGGLVAGFIVLTIGLGSFVFIWRRRRSRERNEVINVDVEDDFEQETGPRRYTYNELSRATNGFPDDGKLGQGGFGDVYKGYLTDICREVAVKKISRGSKQGKKEYVSEVKIISRLRHKNLVQLLGWCHERGVLLLVYDFMPNGSLDSYLSSGETRAVLPWTVRFKIAQDLASALQYLHQDCEQCVLHRDIKPSNVMLDSKFNAKLGDFGLARLVDHKLGARPTRPAGTLGYLAPECIITGHATKESDVFSFGVVALEIASGMRPVESKVEHSKEMSMIEWVWHLYGEGRLLEAIDEKLKGEVDIQQIECLLVVGLWCCHPEYTFRPSIRQVVNVLNLESPLPTLPSKFPVPIYCLAPMNEENFYITSSSGITGSSGTTSS